MWKLVVMLLVCCSGLLAEDNVTAAVRGVAIIRGQMRDPDSLVIETVYAKADKKPDRPVKTLFCYRARNGYGGYTKEMIRVEGEKVFLAVSDGCDLLGVRRITKGGWVDITDEYLRASALTAPSDAK